MTSKNYNQTVIQYTDVVGNSFFGFADEASTASNLTDATAAFESHDAGDLSFTRFFNSETGIHYYTSQADEAATIAGFEDTTTEGEAFRLFSTQVNGTEAVFRLRNTDTGDHAFSLDEGDISALVGTGKFVVEGIVGYASRVDTTEADGIESNANTISQVSSVSDATFASDGAFSLDVPDGVFQSSGSGTLSVTAMMTDGTDLPSYLGYNESTDQFFGYTMKDGIGSMTVGLLADDGTEEQFADMTISFTDVDDKDEADQFTEKSLEAVLDVNAASYGPTTEATDTTVSQDVTLTTSATPDESTNLATFLAANPGITGAGSTIAVLDTGIDLDHPFFGSDANGDGVSDRIVAAQDFHGDGNGAQDAETHGTHVSGIAMSSDGTFSGSAPGANVAAIQVLGANGGSFQAIEAGLQWVIDNAVALNIDVVNMSLGASDNSTSTELSPLSDELAALRSMGVITVVAAGNSFQSLGVEGVSTPASDPSVAAISALNSNNDGAASYSQRDGTLTKVFAPGTNITNAAPGDGAAVQTLSGTSMATPYVAGVAALMRQLNPNLTVDEFETFLQNSASIFNDSATGSDYRQLDVAALGTLVAGGSLPDEPTSPAPVDPTDDHPDSVGSNNTAIAAGGSATGTLEASGDLDVFSLAVTAGATYTIDLRGSPSGVGTLSDPLVRVLDGSGSQLAIDDDSGTGFESQVEYTATSSGTVFIEARAFSSQTGTYQIDVAQSSSDDFVDSIGGNTSISAGVSQTGNIEVARDVDVFQLAVTAGSSYTVDLRGAPSGLGTLSDPLVRVLDSSGNLIASNDDGGSGLESQLTFTATSTGSVFVEAGAFSINTGTYQLDVTDLTNQDDNPDSIGGNASLTVGVDQTGSIEEAGDVDVFALSVVAGGSYTIDQRGFFTGQGTLTDPLLRLRDSAGNLLLENDDGGFRLDSQFTFTSTANQTLYVEAGAFSTRSGTYTLSVGLNGVETIIVNADDGTVDLEIGSTVSGNIDFGGDTDLYEISVTEGATYQVDMTGSTSGMGSLADAKLQIVDADGTVLFEDDDSGRGLESQLTFTAETSGMLFVQASAFGAAQTGTYQLGLTQTAASTDELGDTVGSSLASSSASSIGTSFEGEIEFNGDKDTYSYELQAGVTYQFDARGSHSGVTTLWDPQLELLDSNGNLLVQDDDSGTGFDARITYTPTESGAFALNVFGNPSFTDIGTYSVESSIA